MSLRFPFVYAQVADLGKLFYPFVRASLKTVYGWQEFDFLLDTGADVTTLPRTMLPILGLKNKSLHKQKTQGVGGIWIETLETLLPIRIGSDEFPIHASITNTEEEGIPLLLGRKDIFENRFNLEVNSKEKVTILKRN
ncbi:aspartyl protease family protein [Candidatus Shapirobacteria bacterium]|nr:aspartyl protease family protein [Candidatus Shapirobacteria bacterium]